MNHPRPQPHHHPSMVSLVFIYLTLILQLSYWRACFLPACHHNLTLIPTRLLLSLFFFCSLNRFHLFALFIILLRHSSVLFSYAVINLLHHALHSNYAIPLPPPLSYTPFETKSYIDASSYLPHLLSSLSCITILPGFSNVSLACTLACTHPDLHLSIFYKLGFFLLWTCRWFFVTVSPFPFPFFWLLFFSFGQVCVLTSV
jgi:hypothetical protein